MNVNGVSWLDWQPAEEGSAPVVVPMASPLAQAVAAQRVIGPAYLLTAYGRPLASTDAVSDRFKSCCEQAGLEDRSTPWKSRGSRRADGPARVSQYHIMAVHGHTQAKTIEIYTSGVNSRQLTAEAMRAMDGMVTVGHFDDNPLISMSPAARHYALELI